MIQKASAGNMGRQKAFRCFKSMLELLKMMDSALDIEKEEVELKKWKERRE